MLENDFKKVLENLKILLKNMQIMDNKEATNKIFDKDVAKKLRINQQAFATMKKRGSIPYKELIEWSYRNGICVNKILFETVKLEGCNDKPK